MKRFFSINHKLTCNNKCLVYLLNCKICGIQYVSQTIDKFRLRWNNYKDNARKATKGLPHAQPFIYEPFSSEDHNGFLKDCSIKLTDKPMVLHL